MTMPTPATLGYGSTPRTKRLRAKRLYPGVMDEATDFTTEERTLGEVDYKRETKAHTRAFATPSSERARLYTEAYREGDGQPQVIRRAKAVANVLDNMTIYIEQDELIVGNYAPSPDTLPSFPELDYAWLEKEISPGGLYYKRVSEDVDRELHEIHRYWSGKSFLDRVRAALPPDLHDWWDFNGVVYIGDPVSSDIGSTQDHKRLLQLGQSGIVKMCKDKLEQVRQQGTNDKTAAEYLDQTANLEAMIIANEAFGRFGKRYAKLAREMAEREKSPGRARELENIAEVCDWVPANPPRTFWEALQSFFFSHMLRMTIAYCSAGIGMRFDVTMYPFYERDKNEGKITRDQALEILECLWVKMEGISSLRAGEGGMVSAGSTQYQTFTLGGVDEKGEDATNDLSYMCVEASMNVHTIQPTLVIRYHPKIDPRFIDRAIDCIRTGLGFPSFNSDAQGIAMLQRRGVPSDEAWDWVIPSCVTLSMPNRNVRTGSQTVSFLSAAKCLDLALNNGHCKFLNRQLGTETGDPTRFRDIDDFKGAYLRQVNYMVDKIIQVEHIARELWHRYQKKPLLSAHLDGCIEQGKDATDFTPYESGWTASNDIKVGGLINVADSLAAIKKLVFDDRVVTIEELLGAMRDNWQGKEDLRQMCLNVPKYGNDDDYADEMAQWVHYSTQAEVSKFKCYSGADLWIDGGIVAGYYSLARACAATPDGRRDCEPFADGTGSPMAGMDTQGPTATVKSLSKIDPQKAHDILFNQRFMPDYLQGKGKRLFAQYLKTWYDLGCYHIQFNCIGKDVLLDAQAHPERYADLVVRVAGYSAYWVDLSKPLQDSIIRRTEQCFA